MITIQLWVATMPRHRTVRAEKIRTTAGVCGRAGGRSPALDLSAFLQSTIRSPVKWSAVAAATGSTNTTAKSNKKVISIQRPPSRACWAKGPSSLCEHAAVRARQPSYVTSDSIRARRSNGDARHRPDECGREFKPSRPRAPRNQSSQFQDILSVNGSRSLL